MLKFSGTEKIWQGERINGVAHPRNIETLWTSAELTEIGVEKYVAPVVEPIPIDPLTLPTTRLQFKSILRINNLLEVIKTAIEMIPDATTRAMVLTKFEENDRYSRNDPLFATLGTTLGLTDMQIDAMWVAALEIV